MPRKVCAVWLWHFQVSFLIFLYTCSYHHGLFAFPLGVIDRLWSVIVAIPGHLLYYFTGVVGWCEGAVYLTSLGRPTDIGLQFGKACYPCSG